jgi:hypothetical protein
VHAAPRPGGLREHGVLLRELHAQEAVSLLEALQGRSEAPRARLRIARARLEFLGAPRLDDEGPLEHGILSCEALGLSPETLAALDVAGNSL